MNSPATRRVLFNYTLVPSSLALAVLAAGLAAPVQAEDEARAERLEEVMVTARRREENLQDVPIAVSAFGAQQIKDRMIRTEADLQMNVPGLMVRVTNSSQQLNYSLRGQSIDPFSYSAPAVLPYVNEVHAGGVTASAFFDLESIQVLKGPQGTLFGRNATGGAVLYQTQRPEREFGGYIRGGLGNYSNQEIEGAINLPLSESWYLRLAGLSKRRDGWQDNVYNGDELAEVETDNLRLSLAYETDRLQNQFMAYYGEHGGNPEGLRIRNAYEQGELNPKTGVPAGNVLFDTSLYPEGILATGLLNENNPRVVELGFDGLQDFITKQSRADFHDVYNDLSEEIDTEHTLLTNTTSWEINDLLTLRNTIGYNDVESFQPTDLDGSPFMVMRQGTPEKADGFDWNTEQLSNELQLQGEAFDGKLDYIVGLYISRETNENRIPVFLAADYPFLVFGGPFDYWAEIDNDSEAVFAQGTYAFNERWNFTLGYRHTWAEVSISQDPGSTYYGIAEDSSDKEDRPSWNLSLDYIINDDSMIYVTSRGSWRTGGFNVTAVNATPEGVFADDFLSEKTWDVELGYKFTGVLADMPARLNLAIYEQVIEDVQRTVFLGLASLTGNVEEAKVTGAEIEFQINPVDWLDLGLMYAYTDARFTKPQGNVSGYEYDFGPYADSPEDMVSAYFVTSHSLGNTGTLNFRGDYYYTSDTYFSSLDDSIAPGTELDSYHLVNLRLWLEDIAGTGLSLVAYVRNATDEEYERGGLPMAGVFGSNATIAGAPRTYGIEATYRF